jgi:two-component system cell cycle sensor histidine kinase/response regulator CckA
MLTSAISRPAFASTLSPGLPRANGELILVVDDQQDVRDLLATVLSDHGYRPLLAVDGADALAVFNQQAGAVAAVVTDLSMPRIDGASLADRLRQLRADIPILFMSGLYEGAGGRRSLLSKAPFLQKPFRPVTLLEAIHQLLRLHRAPQS